MASLDLSTTLQFFLSTLINNNPVNQISYNYPTTVGGIAILLDLDLSSEGLPEGNTYSVINSCLIKELTNFHYPFLYSVFFPTNLPILLMFVLTMYID